MSTKVVWLEVVSITKMQLFISDEQLLNAVDTVKAFSIFTLRTRYTGFRRPRRAKLHLLPLSVFKC